MLMEKSCINTKPDTMSVFTYVGLVSLGYTNKFHTETLSPTLSTTDLYCHTLMYTLSHRERKKDTETQVNPGKKREQNNDVS